MNRTLLGLWTLHDASFVTALLDDKDPRRPRTDTVDTVMNFMAAWERDPIAALQAAEPANTRAIRLRALARFTPSQQPARSAMDVLADARAALAGAGDGG